MRSFVMRRMATNASIARCLAAVLSDAVMLRPLMELDSHSSLAMFLSHSALVLAACIILVTSSLSIKFSIVPVNILNAPILGAILVR